MLLTLLLKLIKTIFFKKYRFLNNDYEIFVRLIVREKDGLAMSSRNKYLNNNEFSLGSKLYKSLQDAKLLIDEGERDSKQIKIYPLNGKCIKN